MVNASTYRKVKLLNTSELKSILKIIINEILPQYEYQLFGWVILPDHYHLLFKSKIGRVLPDVMRKVHSKSAVYIKKLIENPTRIWSNYWDSCVRDERSLYVHLNYIHQNPVKHGLVKNPADYEFSSYGEYLKSNGEQWLLDMFRKYPVIDFMKNDD